jgi:hypothetical protein
MDRHRLQRAIIQIERHLLNCIVVKEEATPYVIFFQIMYFILSMTIYVGIILLDMLQCLICIVRIHLSSTCDRTTVLICKSLVLSMSYY